MLAGQMFLNGGSVEEVVEYLEVSLSSAKRWKRAVKEGGLEALKAKPHLGPKPRLDAKQKHQLVEILLAGPRAAGYANNFWTCQRVAEVVAKKFQVNYHHDYMGPMLHDLGWSCQKPEQRAREADDDALNRWRQEDWPRIKKGLAATAVP